MKIFRLWGSQDYWTIHYGNPADIKSERYLAEFKGMPVVKDWKKVEAKIAFKGEQGKIKPDIMDVGGLVGIAMTSHTKDILKNLLLPYCEILPVDLQGEEVYIINPTVILDCIDYENCITELRAPLNRKKIVRYAFKKEIEYPPIFRINNESFCIFITDEFAKILEDNHLVGYNMKELWDSEKWSLISEIF